MPGVMYPGTWSKASTTDDYHMLYLVSGNVPIALQVGEIVFDRATQRKIHVCYDVRDNRLFHADRDSQITQSPG